MKAEIELDADTPELAVKMAEAKWRQDRRALLVSNSMDEGSADDWRPIAEAADNSD